MTNAKAKILCVDDDPDLLLINSSLLQLAGHQVLTASNGNECLEIARQENPDLVLLDVMLPDISGYDVCKRIKTDPELQDTFVILISGIQISSESQIKGLETGADGYIVRPISTHEFLARVQAMIRIKHAEMALRRSMERYQMLVETMNEGLGVLDKNGVITFVNEKICDMIGCARDEIIGRPATDFIDGNDLNKYKEHFEAHREGIFMPFELTCVRKDGQKVYTIISPRPVLDDRGNFTGAFAVISDITTRRDAEEAIRKLNEELEQRVIERTRQLEVVVEELEGEIIERKRVEDALKENEEKFSAITITATDAVILMNDKGKISYWNPAAEKIFGYTNEEALEKELHLLIVPEEYYKAFREGFRFFQATGKGPVIGKTLEFMAVRKDGTVFPIEISISVINVRDKWEAVGIIRDITERKLDEKTFIQYAERLQTLSSRLIEVQEAERRLIAQELHDEIGQSLTGLKLYLENIAALPAEEMTSKLGDILTLVQELMSKLRNMSLDLRPSMLDDLGLLPALLWHFERYITQTNVHVRFNHNGLNMRFNTDIETAAYRIVQEALTNVARHAHVSEVKVLVTANQDTLEIYVEDKGRGFDYDAIKDSANTAGIKWMQERLSLLGGYLKIDSAPGEGARLSARIPVKNKSAERCTEQCAK